MDSRVTLGLWAVFTIVSWIVYHKVFAVYYFDFLRGIIKEFIISVLAGAVLTVLSLYFWQVSVIIIILIGIAAVSKVSTPTMKLLTIIAFIVLAVVISIVGTEFKEKTDEAAKEDAKKSESSNDNNNLMFENQVDLTTIMNKKPSSEEELISLLKDFRINVNYDMGEQCYVSEDGSLLIGSINLSKDIPSIMLINSVYKCYDVYCGLNEQDALNKLAQYGIILENLSEENGYFIKIGDNVIYIEIYSGIVSGIMVMINGVSVLSELEKAKIEVNSPNIPETEMEMGSSNIFETEEETDSPDIFETEEETDLSDMPENNGQNLEITDLEAAGYYECIENSDNFSLNIYSSPINNEIGKINILLHGEQYEEGDVRYEAVLSKTESGRYHGTDSTTGDRIFLEINKEIWGDEWTVMGSLYINDEYRGYFAMWEHYES